MWLFPIKIYPFETFPRATPGSSLVNNKPREGIPILLLIKSCGVLLLGREGCIFQPTINKMLILNGATIPRSIPDDSAWLRPACGIVFPKVETSAN